jgi:hypothetical protein
MKAVVWPFTHFNVHIMKTPLTFRRILSFVTMGTVLQQDATSASKSIRKPYTAQNCEGMNK